MSQSKVKLKLIFGWVVFGLTLVMLGGIFGDYASNTPNGLQALINGIQESVSYFKLGGVDSLTGLQIGLPYYLIGAVMVFGVISLLVSAIMMLVSLVASVDKRNFVFFRRSLFSAFSGIGYSAGILYLVFTAEASNLANKVTLGWGAIITLVAACVVLVIAAISNYLFEEDEPKAHRCVKSVLMVLVGALSVTMLLGTVVGDLGEGVVSISSPYPYLLGYVNALFTTIAGGSVPSTKSIIDVVVLLVLTLVICSVGGSLRTIFQEFYRTPSKKANAPKRHPHIAAIVCASICTVLYVGATVSISIVYKLQLSFITYVNYGLLALTLALTFVLAALGKKIEVEEAPVLQPLREKEPVEESAPVAEPSKEEEKPTQEEKVEKAVAAAIVIDAIVNEKEEEQKVEEEAPKEEKSELPTEEPVNEEAKEEKKEAPIKKEPAKKEVSPKKEAVKKESKPAPKKEEGEKKEVKFRTYHLVKREEDGKWEVKYAGGQKAIKLFDTQKEALEYSKKMAENQGGKVLVHNSKGENKGRIKKKN